MITDLSLPGMSGFDVAKGAKALRSSIPVLLVSGWAIQHDSEDVRAAGVDTVIPKPCSAETLLRAIQASIAAEGGESPADLGAQPSAAPPAR